MKPSRRSFGALLAGGLLAPISGAQAAGAAASPYPALAKLAQLLPDRPGCRRLAERGLAQRFDGPLLRALDAKIAQALNAGESPAAVLQAQNAADFREGRTLELSGFLLAQTEAAAALLRARPNHA